MASSLTLVLQAIPQGTSVLRIDGLPPAANGFNITLTRDASWDAVGALFSFLIEISPDNGVSFLPWIQGTMNGGPAGLNRQGLPNTVVSWTALWPGIYPNGVDREILKQTDVRITFNAARAFTTPLINVSAV